MLKSRIDVHGHYFPPTYYNIMINKGIDFPDGFPRPNWSEEEHLSDMEKLNIVHSVISVSSPHLNIVSPEETIELARISNEEGADFAIRHSDKISLMCVLPLPDLEASLKEIKYCNEVLGIKNFAVPTNARGVYLGDPKLDPVFEELNSLKSVVALHPTEPSAIPRNVMEVVPYPLMEFFFDTTRAVSNMVVNGTIKKFPNIKFIIPHAGAFLPILSDRLHSFSEIVKMKSGKEIDVFGDLGRLYYDLSGFSIPKQFDVLKQIVPTSQILYGSDGPFTPMAARLALAELMDKTPKIAETERNDIYIKNAEKIFGFKF